MQFFVDIFEAIRDFMELGGPVLTLIAWTIFFMWLLIVERLIYFQTGLKAEDIRSIAAELADVAFKQEVVIDQPWTDWAGRKHDKMIGRPISMHAMRGISAHSNGFQTCRMIHILQILLGSIDCPGGFRYKPPYPKQAPPWLRPHGKEDQVKANVPLGGPHLGFPLGPRTG